MECGDTEELAVLLRVGAEAGQLLALPGLDVEHVVVEARHIDAAVRGVQRGAELGHRLDGIAQHAAVQAGVEVAAGAGDLDIKKHKTAETAGEHDLILGGNAGVGQVDEICLQPVAVGLKEFGKARAADLLLALDQETDAQRQVRAAFEQPSHGRDVGHERPLVVRRAAAKDTLTADLGLEGRRLPEIERIRRLHVVVTIDDHMGPMGGPSAVGQDDGMEVGRHHLHREANRGQKTGDKFARAGHSGLRLGIGRDTGVTDKLLQFFNRVKHASTVTNSSRSG
jgi:hypothetical protein